MRLLAGLALSVALIFSGSSVFGGAPLLNLDFSLPVPQDAHARSYLGLNNEKTFTLDRVKADILIIEIFSMYCPICQREAPKVNELFSKLNSLPGKTIKLIGIGAGNSDFETRFFKETYTIKFPLFSDGDFVIHKKVGEKGTPFFIGIKPEASPEHRIFFTHSGEIKDLDDFMAQLIKAYE